MHRVISIDPLVTAAIRAKTGAGLALINSTGTTVATIGAGPGTGTTFAGGVNAAAITSTSASGVTTLQAATQDAVRILGRAGGTASRTLTITTAALGADRTVTFPDATITVAGSASALTSGRVPFVTTGGLLTDSAEVTYSSSALRIGTAAIVSPTDATTYLQISSVSAVAPSLSVYHNDGGNNTRSYFAAVSATGKTLIANSGSTGINGFTFRIGTTDRLDITAAQAVFSVTGGVTVPNGTAAAPGIRLAGSVHGLYLASAASLGFVANGAVAATLSQGSLSLGAGVAAEFTAGISTAAGYNRRWRSQTAGVARWDFVLGNSTAEGGSDAGSNVGLVAYTDAGVVIDNPLTIVRASGGAITLARPVTCKGALTVPNGTAAAPGIRLTSEASGLYRIGAASVGVSVAGALVLTVGSTASSFASGTTLAVSNTTASTSTTTGALTVAGGVGVAGRVSATEFASGATKVVGAQGAAVADAGAGSGTATNGGWGFTSEAEFNAFITAFNAMKDSYNAALSRLRAHGLIAT